MAKVLIIEDEKSLRTLYEQDLRRDGHEVVSAATAKEGLEILEAQSPDLIVLDIRMPGMDGLEAMGRILDRHPRLPVILNSAYSSYKDNFMSWAADAYVVKSSDTSELRARVREILEARRTEAAGA